MCECVCVHIFRQVVARFSVSENITATVEAFANFFEIDDVHQYTHKHILVYIAPHLRVHKQYTHHCTCLDQMWFIFRCKK